MKNLLAVTFEKKQAERYLDCFKNNKPFEPADNEKGWTWDDLFILAFVLSFEMTCGLARETEKRETEAKPGDDLVKHCEHREARLEASINSVLCALSFGQDLICLIKAGEYDSKYPPKHIHSIKPSGEQPRFSATMLSEDSNNLLRP